VRFWDTGIEFLLYCFDELQVQSFIRQFSAHCQHDFKKIRDILTSPGGDYKHKYVLKCDALLCGTYLPSYKALYLRTQQPSNEHLPVFLTVMN